jgi:hypothetical protein
MRAQPTASWVAREDAVSLHCAGRNSVAVEGGRPSALAVRIMEAVKRMASGANAPVNDLPNSRCIGDSICRGQPNWNDFVARTWRLDARD